MPQVDWTSLLAEHGLESPGYREAVEASQAALDAKKAAIQLQIQDKAKGKPRLKRGKR
jgi:hypothetical protein